MSHSQGKKSGKIIFFLILRKFQSLVLKGMNDLVVNRIFENKIISISYFEFVKNVFFAKFDVSGHI